MEEETRQIEIETEKPVEKDGPSKHTLFSIGLTVFLTFFACIIVFFLFLRYQGFTDGWNNLLRVLQPILFGAVTAYLVNPIMKVYEKRMLGYFSTRSKDLEKTKHRVRSVTIALGLATFVGIIAIIIGIIIPQMVNNISDLTKSVPKEIERFTGWLEDNADAPIVIWFSDLVTDLGDSIVDFFKSDFLSEAMDYIMSIANGVYLVFRTILNLIIGLIVAIYILQSKERFAGQTKKIIYAIWRPYTGNKIIHVMRRSNEIFGGFIIGKIIDSLIIGVIAYVACKIMRMPYSALLATIIGVTNIIPFFGPFIGAIPCLILVVLYNPLQALYLLIFIIILQQVDGNIIGPKILGDSTGLSSFWVIFAILIGGGFFGVIGMILGVPVFAVIYYLLKKLFERRLRHKGLPTETDTYVRAVKIDSASGELKYPEDLGDDELNAASEDRVKRTGIFSLRQKKK